jgi:hypothetical protein
MSARAKSSVTRAAKRHLGSTIHPSGASGGEETQR